MGTGIGGHVSVKGREGKSLGTEGGPPLLSPLCPSNDSKSLHIYKTSFILHGLIFQKLTVKGEECSFSSSLPPL